MSVRVQDVTVMPEDLNAAEKRLWTAFPRGQWVDLRGEPERVVRAAVIQAALLGACETEPGHTPGVRLRGAMVTGRLDLISATVESALVCEYCQFDEPLRLVEATTRTVRLVHSRLAGFNGVRMQVVGILNLNGTLIERGLWLDQARVTGQVSLRGATTRADAEGIAIAARGLTVDGDVAMCDGFLATGSVLVHRAQINGGLDCFNARFSYPGAVALDLSRTVIGAGIGANELIAEGELRMRGTRVMASVQLAGALLQNPGGDALGAGGLEVRGGLWCREGFSAVGGVRLVGSQLGANVTFTDAKLSHPGGVALNLDHAAFGDFDGARLEVSGGTISVSGARAAAGVNLEEARLNSGADKSFVLESAEIGGGLFFRRLHATGEVCVQTSRISGRILLEEARLDNASATALRFSGIHADASLSCAGMRVRGGVKLTGSRCDQGIDLDGAILASEHQPALDATAITTTVLSLRPAAPIRGEVIFRHARIDLLRDDPTYWPERLRLEELTYQALDPRLPARERLGWLARDPDGPQPQPYEQLAALYTRLGQPAEASKVMYARERDQRAAESALNRVWSILQDVTVAYGYHPWRALAWLAALLTVGSILYGLMPPVPLKPGEAPHFNPVIYTLDLLLPIVDMGQQNAFNPSGAEQWFSYVLITAGWILATTVAAGVARVTSRR